MGRMTASRDFVTGADQATVPEQAPPDGGRSPGWRRWLVAAAWVLGVAVAFGCYLRLAGTRAVNSDGASQALQAWDMLHGNLLLRGWRLSDVSFYTTELPQYMLVELVRGLHAGVVHVAAAMTYTLAVLLAALLAKGRATGGGPLRPGAARGRDHARPAAGLRGQHPHLLAGSHRHDGAGAGGLADPGPGPAALVCPGGRGGAARLGGGGGHAGALHRGAAARAGLRDPGLPGPSWSAAAAGVAVV